MSRFDQCSETCTADCGHCKGRPVVEMRGHLALAKRRLSKALDMTESAQHIAAQSIRQRDEAQAELDRALEVVKAAEAWRLALKLDDEEDVIFRELRATRDLQVAVDTWRQTKGET